MSKKEEYRFSENELKNMLREAYLKGYEVRGDRAKGKPIGGFNSWIYDFFKKLKADDQRRNNSESKWEESL